MTTRLQDPNQLVTLEFVPADEQPMPALAEQVGRESRTRDGDAQPELSPAHVQQFDPESVPLDQVIGEHVREGVDYTRICAWHCWASRRVVSRALAMGQRCPYCAAEIDGGRKRYFELSDRLLGIRC